MSRYAAVILAAGRGSRFADAGGSEATKLVADYGGEPLVRCVARAAVESLAHPVIVVTGHAQGSVNEALGDLPLQAIHNSAFAEGLSTSLRCGLAAVPPVVSGVLIILGDMPDVSAATIDELIRHADEQPQADAVVPVCAGRRGNPVLLNRSLFSRIADLTGDHGARRLLSEPDVTVAEIEQSPSILLDIDRPEDLVTALERRAALQSDG